MEVINNLLRRGRLHDQSKLESPEKEAFDKASVLKGLTYGSPEYKQALEDLGPALQHHYEHNSHHPEHYAGGISGMSLMDVVEMFCDWKAAGERHATGSLARSLEFNEKRFSISPQLLDIFQNTAKQMGWT